MADQSAIEGAVYELEQDPADLDPFNPRKIRAKVLAIRANAAGFRFVQYRLIRDDGEFSMFGPSSTSESAFLRCWRAPIDHPPVTNGSYRGTP